MMGKYVYVFTGGGIPQSEEEGQRVMAAWNAWFETLGSAVVDQGAPFGPSTSVKGGSAVNATGYSIVSAESLDAAAEMAKSCPILEGGGNVEVYETLAM
jgi:hypothetical protein